MILGCIACLLMTVITGCAAGSLLRTCDSNSQATCLAPSLRFISSRDFQELLTVKDISEITETQVVGVCRMVRTYSGCSKDMAECVFQESDMPDTFEILAGTAKLLQACDRPDFYSKFQIIAQCSASVNQSTSGAKKVRGCYNAYMREAMSVFKPKNDGLSRLESNLAMLQRRDLVRHMCCTMKSYESCVGTELADMCGSSAQEISRSMHNAVKDAFNCNGPRSQNCPVLPPPTAADEVDTFDFTSLFSVGAGGFGETGNVGGSSLSRDSWTNRVTYPRVTASSSVASYSFFAMVCCFALLSLRK